MGEKYLAKWIWMFFAQIHCLPGFPLKSFVLWRTSTGLPFVRRPWKTIRLRYLYSKSISKHFRKIFNSFQKARRIWVKNISPSEINSFLLKSTVFRASNWNPLLQDRGRPSDLDICTVTQYLSIFAKHFIGFREGEKYGRKISRKVKLKVFFLKSTVFRASHWNPLFHDGLLTVFLLLEDRGRPSDFDICTITQYLSIFAKYLIGFRKREKYGRKISRKVKLNVFCSNPRSSGLSIEIFCFMTGF